MYIYNIEGIALALSFRKLYKAETDILYILVYTCTYRQLLRVYGRYLCVCEMFLRGKGYKRKYIV